MIGDDWQKYGTHHDAEAAREMRSKTRVSGFETPSLFSRLEWLPDAVRESWQTMADDGWRFYMIMCDKRTGEIQHWCSRARSTINIWKNRNHPQFPWEIIIFIKIK